MELLTQAELDRRLERLEEGRRAGVSWADLKTELGRRCQ